MSQKDFVIVDVGSRQPFEQRAQSGGGERDATAMNNWKEELERCYAKPDNSRATLCVYINTQYIRKLSYLVNQVHSAGSTVEQGIQ